jgi:hypothetical protein
MTLTLSRVCERPETEGVMIDLMTWRGTSGIPYQYWVLPLSSKFKPVDGNYVFAKRNLLGGWEAVYIGQGELSSRADVRFHHKGSFILEKGATHVHVRENPSLLERMTEWADVLDSHPEALEPIGCNGSAMAAGEELCA